LSSYRTLTGFHLLGEFSNFHAQIASGWQPPVKLVEVGTGAAVEVARRIPKDQPIILRFWQYKHFRSDGWIDWIDANGTADQLFYLLKPELDILATADNDMLAVELFNESGWNPAMGSFYLRFAQLLQEHYHGKIHVAALSLSGGSYNDFAVWESIADELIAPALRQNLPAWLSLHAYSSYMIKAGNFAGMQHSELRSDTNLRLDIIPELDITRGHEGMWTGLAYWEVVKYLYKLRSQHDGLDLHRIPIVLTETNIDNMGAVFGITAGGWLEWARKSAYAQTRIYPDNKIYTPDELIAHGMWFNERFARECNKAGANIIGIFPFTYTDSNQASRWHQDYRVMGAVQNVFCYLARTATPDDTETEPLPNIDNLSYCAIATKTHTPVNVRSTPEIADNIITQLNPLTVYKVSHYVLATNGEKWYRVEYQQSVYAWCSASVTRTNCDDIPLYSDEEPTQPKLNLLELIILLIKWLLGLK